jgi:hypothetical protein
VSLLGRRQNALQLPLDDGPDQLATGADSIQIWFSEMMKIAAGAIAGAGIFAEAFPA